MEEIDQGKITYISIHAPVKGATPQQVLDTAQELYISIHAPVKGATPPRYVPFLSTAQFQSTHP